MPQPKQKHSNHPRVRCLLCGGLPYLSQLRKFYPLELKIQIVSGGRGRSDNFIYHNITDYDRLQEVEDFLIKKMQQILKEHGVKLRFENDYSFATAINQQRIHSYPTEVDYNV